MRKPMIATAVVAAGLAALAGAAVATGRPDPTAAKPSAEEVSYTDAHLADAAVTQADAEKAALARRPGTLVGSHLENEGHGLRWRSSPTTGATSGRSRSTPAPAPWSASRSTSEPRFVGT